MSRILAFALAFVALQAASQVPAPAGLPTRNGLPTLAPVLEKVVPAVVNIAVRQRSPTSRQARA